MSLLLFPYLEAFFQAYVYSSITIADIAIFVLLLRSILSLKGEITSIKLKNYEYILLLFVVISIIGIIFIGNKSYINYVAYVNNITRLLIYVLSTILIPRYIYKKNILPQLINAVKNTIIVVCLISIVEFILKYIGYNPIFTVIFTGDNYYYNFHERITGIYTEPAQLSIFIALYVSIILLSKRKLINTFNDKVVIYLSAIVLLIAFSFTGYLMLFGIVAMILSDSQIQTNKKIFYMFGFLVALFVLYNVIGDISYFDKYTTGRIINMANNEDGSSYHRLFGMYELFSRIMQDSMIFGRGFGQQESYFISDPFYYTYSAYNVVGRTSSINNVFVSVLSQSGLIGLILFVYYIISIYKYNYGALVVLILVCFAWGGFNNSIMWFYYLMSIAILNYSENITFSIKK